METICHHLPGRSNGKKLYYYTDSSLFKCYTECEGLFDIFELIMKVELITNDEEVTLQYAIAKVIDFLDLDPTLLMEDNTRNGGSAIRDHIELIQFYSKIIKLKKKIPLGLKSISESELDNLSFAAPAPWLNEGITVPTMQEYGIKYHGTQHKIVIPHYSHTGDLVGIRFRALVEEEIERYGKYGPLILGGVMYNHAIGQNLYGLNKTIHNIRTMKKIIIFESEKSVLLYDSLFGFENNISVAICGSSLSMVQLEIIKVFTPEVNEIVIALDKQWKERGDNEFLKQTKNLTSMVERIGKNYSVSIIFDKEELLDYKDSPIDKGKEIFEKLFEQRLFQK